jgi:protein SCO1/2
MKWRIICVGVVIPAFLLGPAQHLLAQGQTKAPEPTAAGRAEAVYRGGLVTPPLRKPRFTLTDTSGASFDFWSRTQGSVALLYFGYTHCADMCPLEMSMIAKALKRMPADSAHQLKVIFVTTDPARDSATVLRSWLNQFDRRFIGLTGSEAAIKAAQLAANIPADQREQFKKVMTTQIDIAALSKAMTDAMVKNFTTEELKALADFYGSPVGKSAMQKFGAYMADIMPVVQAEIMKAAAKMEH